MGRLALDWWVTAAIAAAIDKTAKTAASVIHHRDGRVPFEARVAIL
jgi:hypothetical protein